MIKKVLFILFLSLPTFAQAQVDATLSVTPQNPAPYQQVTVTLSSYSFDVNVANIVWSSGNKVLLSGVGQKTLSLTLGDGGQTIPISYKATTAEGEVNTGSVSLTPQSVDLLYQSPESYVPPFYEGRSLPGEGAIITAFALPTIYESGAKVPPSYLSYNWYVNDEFSDRASGLGKESARIAMEYLSSSTKVRVVVRSPRGNTAEKTITIYPHDVMPTLYPYDDVLGVDFTKPFIRRMELGSNIILSLEPFYFSTKGELSKTASYTWYLDGLPVTPQEKTLLELRPKENSAGTKTLSVALENSKRLLQKAKNTIEVVFDTRN